MTVAERAGTPDIFAAIVDAVRSVAPDGGSVDMNTYLLGPKALLDSVGFITLLIAIEQNLSNSVDLSTALMAQEGVEEADSPFLTVGSLAEYIGQLLLRA